MDLMVEMGKAAEDGTDPMEVLARWARFQSAALAEFQESVAVPHTVTNPYASAARALSGLAHVASQA